MTIRLGEKDVQSFEIFVLIISAFMFMSSMVQAASVPESSDPIKVIKNDWTGQLFSTEVVGELFNFLRLLR